MANKPDEIPGTQRAAILLMSLGEQDAANVLKQLDAKEVQKLGIAMAELKEISRHHMSSVLDKFISIADAKANVAGGSPDYVRRVLTQAVGKQKTDMLLDRVASGQTGQGIEALKWMEAKAVAQIISGEHPQIAAIVLAHRNDVEHSNKRFVFIYHRPANPLGITPKLMAHHATLKPLVIEALYRNARAEELPQDLRHFRHSLNDPARPRIPGGER